MDQFWNFIEEIGALIWSPPTFIGLLGAGVLFTVWSRFTQYRVMTHGIDVIRGIYDDPDDPGAISHFQALSAALSATVGLGNIGGVALAISLGGPGALFWMWVVGFFGMALKTIEITLAMMFRDTSDPDNPSGGAMHVVRHVMGKKGGMWATMGSVIGGIFCVTLIISTITGGNMFQSWNVALLTQSYFGVPKIATGIILALVVGMVIIGGIRRIGTVAGKLVPLMCLLYLLAGLAVLVVKAGEIPATFALIFQSAFAPIESQGAFVGGTLGFAFMVGMKRALFSNEAGQGSAPIAHAAAKTGEPAREGIVGGIGPFIDTICICTLTALVILTTGTWNREAIGPLGAEVKLVVAAESDDAFHYDVNTNASISDLPEPLHGPWSKGDKVFLLADVTGLKSQNTGGSTLKIQGKIVANEAKPDAAEILVIEWKAVELTKSIWDGVPGEIHIQQVEGGGAGVFKEHEGAQLTAIAFDRVFDGLGKYLVTLAAWLFAISTMISWSYYGEKGVTYLFGNAGVLPYKIAFLILAIVGATSIDDTTQMLLLADLGTGTMLVVNIPIVILLGGLAVASLREYDRKLKAGEFPRNDQKE